MEYLHGLILYENPRKCLYRSDINQYDLTKGWLTEDTEATVIGEDNHCYITKTFRTDEYWEHPDKPPLKGDLLSGIGFHKTRFIKWLDTQLELF